MAVKTPMPPGPPPRGYQPPGGQQPWPQGPLGQPAPGYQPPKSRGSRAPVIIFVGIVAFLLGLVFGYGLGRDNPKEEGAATGTGSIPDVTVPSSTTTAPPATTTTTEASGGPSTPAAPLGTRDHPIPVGQGWVLAVVQAKVVSVDLDAADTIAEADATNQQADADERDILIRLELKLTDPSYFAFADEFRPWLEAPDGERFEIINSTCGPVVPDDLRTRGVLKADKPTSGNLCWRVPKAVAGKMLLATEGIGETTTYFALHK